MPNLGTPKLLTNLRILHIFSRIFRLVRKSKEDKEIKVNLLIKYVKIVYVSYHIGSNSDRVKNETK